MRRQLALVAFPSTGQRTEEVPWGLFTKQRVIVGAGISFHLCLWLRTQASEPTVLASPPPKFTFGPLNRVIPRGFRDCVNTLAARAPLIPISHHLRNPGNVRTSSTGTAALNMLVFLNEWYVLYGNPCTKFPGYHPPSPRLRVTLSGRSGLL